MKSSMTIKTWIIFLLVSGLSVAAWMHFSLPKFTYIDLSLDRNEVTMIAQKHLKEIFHVPSADAYLSATILGSEATADRYLQRAVGFEKEKEFFEENNFELFYWIVRFFKEGEKEEFRFKISPKTGEALSWTHTLDESAKKPLITEEEAKQKAISFLIERLNLDMSQYTLHANSSQKYDERTDFFFSFRKEGIYIPWSREKDTGGVKLLTNVTVSGDEISGFSKHILDIPDQFNRHIAKRIEPGRNFAVLFRIIYLGLFIAAIMILIIRRNHLAMHVTKRSYLWIAGGLFLLIFSATFNYFDYLLYDFPTTSSLQAYTTRHVISHFVTTLLFAVGFMMPALSGELLHHEVFPDKRQGGLLYHVQTGFFNRHVARQIFLGYLAAIIMLGLQTIIFEGGYRFAGVWSEQKWLSDLSTAYVPILGALSIGFVASFSEEILYRVFLISWGKKLIKNTFLVALISSLIWGFGHTGYQIFPMWFRGIEVTCLGLFLAYAYLQYGLITVLVGHFVFDIFWSTASNLIGFSNVLLFSSTLTVLLLPLALGLLAWILNRPSEPKPLEWSLNKHQRFNLDVLKQYLQLQIQKEGFDWTSFRPELISHGWDVAVIDMAYRDLKKER